MRLLLGVVSALVGAACSRAHAADHVALRPLPEPALPVIVERALPTNEHAPILLAAPKPPIVVPPIAKPVVKPLHVFLAPKPKPKLEPAPELYEEPRPCTCMEKPAPGQPSVDGF